MTDKEDFFREICNIAGARSANVGDLVIGSFRDNKRPCTWRPLWELKRRCGDDAFDQVEL